MNRLTALNTLLWGDGLVALLLAAGIFCLWHEKGAAWRSLRRLRSGWNAQGTHVHSPFQACMTSLGAAMGTGNIAGVATALTLGGAGAIFWMWIAGICGMGLLYAENVLSARYRRDAVSGAAAYLRYGLGSKVLAGIFAVCCVMASFGMGCTVQTHTMAQTLRAGWGIPPVLTGILTMAAAGAILLGGAGRIGRFTAWAVPLVSGVYLLGGIWVIAVNGEHLGEAMGAVFRGAFGWDAAMGGCSGELVRRALSVGVRRGVFSNEAGLGSTGLLHSGSNRDGAFLGACAIGELIADTFVCCTVTALAILTSGTLECGAEGGELVLLAFRTGMGSLADVLLPPVTAVFAFCTLIGWSFCGESALRSLAGKRAVYWYRAAFCAAAGVGACLEAELVWTLSDLANAGMAYCNLPGVILLYLTPRRESAIMKQESRKARNPL